MEADPPRRALPTRPPGGGALPRIAGNAPWSPLVGAAVALVLYAAHVVTGFAGDGVAAALYVTAIAGAGVASALGARIRPGAPWTLLALAIIGYGTSSAFYTLVPDAADRFPSPYDAGLMAFYPLAILGLAGFVRRHVGGLGRAGWLDASIGALVFAALAAAVMRPFVSHAGGIRLAGQLFYVLADAGFIGTLLAAYALSGLRDGATVMALAGGAALMAVGDGVYAAEVASGNLVATPVSTLAWAAGMTLMTVAFYLPVRPAGPATPPWAKIAVPGLSAAAVVPVDVLSPLFSLQHVLATLALTLVVGRLMMSLQENSRLLASLHGAATTDRLTGLANRPMLFERLEEALARRRDTGMPLAVLFLDLDDFKAINDAHGHDCGDEALIAVAAQLRRAVRCGARERPDLVPAPGSRPRDTIARLGGDEFVVLLEELADGAAAVDVADRILGEIRAPLLIGGHRLFLDTSIGIAESGAGDDRSPEELLGDADTAMYEAKRAGRHRHQVFEPHMRERAVARTELTHALRTAVAAGELRVVYQPQVDLRSGRMTGVEALVRWEHPQHGLIGPDRFIPLAERSGLIGDVDDWVLREACAQLRRWDDMGLAPLVMAVNVSSRRLEAGDLAVTVADVLRETGVEPRRLEVEITESVAVDQDSAGVAAIGRLRELGVSVAIDDFGMGHSALSRLQTFPVDRLKIDRSFVDPLVDEAARGSLVDAMIAMGASLGVRVVAEGVETAVQLRALRALGCPTAQGYLFSRPVAAGAIERIAREGGVLVPDEPGSEAPGVGAGTGRAAKEAPWAGHERLVRSVLAEIERVTGLETTYLTRIDWACSVQHITHARNAGALEIPEGLTVDWSETVCRAALEHGIRYTDDVPGTFPESSGGRDLALQTYLSVPLLDAGGEVAGTLCGASSRRVPLGPAAVALMECSAELIARSGAAAAAVGPDAAVEAGGIRS
jgi:predicted signal transduction protein with EAL and GGDEF domain